MNMILELVKKSAKPFIGRGVIDKRLHFLIPLFEFLYVRLQKREKVTVSIPLGLRMKVFSNDPGVGLSLLTKSEFEPVLTKTILEAVKNGQTFVDVGANYGYYSLLASKLVGPKGTVFAFEPDPENSVLLRENLELNKCSNMLIEQKAVSSKNGDLFFEIQKFNKGESAISQSSSGSRVQSVSLDSFRGAREVKTVDFLKVDVEGAEIEVLKGARKLVKNSPKLILFIEYNPSRIIHYGNKPEDLINLILNLGLKITYIIDESKGLKIPYSQLDLDRVLNHSTYCNLVCKI